MITARPEHTSNKPRLTHTTPFMSTEIAVSYNRKHSNHAYNRSSIFVQSTVWRVLLQMCFGYNNACVTKDVSVCVLSVKCVSRDIL
uniref:Uncharacterized protein n=1 Tax=Pararge aegeria TaxID=116150 RepID=S4P9W8_9NEOP